MLKIGAPAPSFTLPDQDGRPVSLRDLAGRWTVLYFYPRDDTPGCTVEACEFTAALPEFRRLGAEILGCSADSAAAHQRFIEKHELGVRLVTDADKSVMRAYGAWGKKVLYGNEFEGIIRSTVLIAPDGKVAHHWPTVKAAGHAQQVRARLAELAGGGVAAAPGGKTKSKPKPKVAARGRASKAAPKARAKKTAARKKAPAKRTAAKARGGRR
jgi:peroxiredoxin Q/BCP